MSALLSRLEPYTAVRGGARANSIAVEFSRDASFATIDSTSYATLGDGASLQSAYTPSASLRDQMWFVRVTPYNGPISGGVPTGLAGKAQVASVYVTGNVAKKLRIGAQKFIAWTETTTYLLGPSEIQPAAGNTAVNLYYASVELPAGTSVTITGFRLRGYRTSASEVCEAKLLRNNDDGSGTTLATATITANGAYATTSTTSLSETTAGRSYSIQAELKQTGANASRLVYVELDYTMPDYQAAV